MDYRIEVVLKMISRDVHNAPAPRDIANSIGISVSYLYDLFRRETGTVPAAYIRALRYEKAQELLIRSHLSVKEIAHLVGFHDVSHFVREFQKIYGTSPKHFRQLHRCDQAAAGPPHIVSRIGYSANK
jgi:AraC-like DNA-binding protein